MAPPIRTRASFPLSYSVPSGSFHKPLVLLHQRADRMKTTTTENQPIWSHGPQPCLTQWINYEPCRVGAPKMKRSWWRVLTKCGPLEKGMANHFSILVLRTPCFRKKTFSVATFQRPVRIKLSSIFNNMLMHCYIKFEIFLWTTYVYNHGYT